MSGFVAELLAVSRIARIPFAHFFSPRIYRVHWAGVNAEGGLSAATAVVLGCHACRITRRWDRAVFRALIALWDVQDMDISALPAGLYLARVMAPNGSLLHVQRVVEHY